jgi:hypothetical protein
LAPLADAPNSDNRGRTRERVQALIAAVVFSVHVSFLVPAAQAFALHLFNLLS